MVFAVSTNQTQPEISGVFVGIDSGLIRFVATDRYRLAEKKIVIENVPYTHQIIVPKKTMIELSRLIAGQKGIAGSFSQ